MKKILFILMLCAAMVSCSTKDDSYSYEEVMSFLATEVATPTDTGLVIQDNMVLQIVIINGEVYYPSVSYDGAIRYYPARLHD